MKQWRLEMKLLAIVFGLIVFSGVASAQVRLDDTKRGMKIFEADEAFLVCIDVKTDTGEDGPVLLTSEIGGKAEMEKIGMSGTCLNMVDKKNIVIKATAIAEPVTVRVGPNRNALR